MNDKRERILKAAAGEIVENGLQFQMSAIATRAGIATGSVYNYFPSKSALIEGVYAGVAQEMASAVVVDHPVDASHEIRIRRYIDDYIGFIVADAERIALFEYLDNSPALNFKDIAAIFAPLLDYTRHLFQEAQKAKVVREGQAYLLGSFVRGAIRHAVRRRRLIDPSPITEAERSWIADMCWNAVAVATRDN